MITKVSNNENAESGLLPYPVIIAATKGDPEAMAIVVKHYESYIASLSMLLNSTKNGAATAQSPQIKISI